MVSLPWTSDSAAEQEPRINPAMKPLFDPVEFGKKVAGKMERDGLSFREVQEAANVDHTIIRRVVAGKPPRLENYLRLTRWLECR